ncbi:MAG TPA: PfkB family carbohydrate kinase [Vicinamibacterales bacterium]|nr:PfkB family carbohydrate kinase [Vicinamibacterales bacterium]
MIGGAVSRVRTRDKIVPLEDLRRIREEFRTSTIVQCHGAFDLVHVGHLTHLEEARALGDMLVVTITGDQHITKKRSVTFSETQRAHQLAALELVDYVAIVNEPTALSAIESLHPDVYVKGPEYADLTLDASRSIYHEMRVLEGYGGRIHFTSGETFSSTKLAHFLLNAPEAAQRNPLLRNDQILFKDISSFGFRLEQLKAFLAKASALNVCVIGEAIVDEWVDVTLTSLSTQSRCLAGLETARVRQVGGAGIIALHLANFVKHVDCFINRIAADWPDPISVTEVSDGEIVETRFVDLDTGRPAFKTRRATIGTPAADRLPDFGAYDLVLVADFGHGLVDAAAVATRIAAKGRSRVAVMAQVNSANYGYHLPIKHRGADYYGLNRTEAELGLHERGLPLDALVQRSAALLGAKALSVTDGEHGVVVAVDGDAFRLPSLSISAVDTIGCGDAYFALSSAAFAAGMPPPVIALTGSIGAAAMTQRRCNERPVSQSEFLTIGKIVI